MVTHLTTLDVLGLCEAGRYREAKECLPPKSDDPIVLLVYGMVENAAGSPELAKDYLSKTLRLGLPSALADKATTQLALAYWRCGENQEAKTILMTVADCFDSLLIAAIIERPRPKKALALLDEAAKFHVSIGPEGRLHNQRAMVLRQLKENDRAIQEYEAATFCFEHAESYECLAYVANNLAGLYISYDQFEKAHEYIDRVRPLLEKNSPQLGKVLDQKACAYLGEKKFADAELFSTQALKIIKGTEYRGWQGEFLITHAKAVGGLRKFTDAFLSLDQVKALALILSDSDLLFSALGVQSALSKELARDSEKQFIEVALKTSHSLRAAAQRIGTSHQVLLQRIAKHELKSNFKPRRSLL